MAQLISSFLPAALRDNWVETQEQTSSGVTQKVEYLAERLRDLSPPAKVAGSRSLVSTLSLGIVGLISDYFVMFYF